MQLQFVLKTVIQGNVLKQRKRKMCILEWVLLWGAFRRRLQGKMQMDIIELNVYVHTKLSKNKKLQKCTILRKIKCIYQNFWCDSEWLVLKLSLSY